MLAVIIIITSNTEQLMLAMNANAALFYLILALFYLIYSLQNLQIMVMSILLEIYFTWNSFKL